MVTPEEDLLAAELLACREVLDHALAVGTPVNVVAEHYEPGVFRLPLREVRRDEGVEAPQEVEAAVDVAHSVDHLFGGRVRCRPNLER